MRGGILFLQDAAIIGGTILIWVMSNKSNGNFVELPACCLSGWLWIQTSRFDFSPLLVFFFLSNVDYRAEPALFASLRSEIKVDPYRWSRTQFTLHVYRYVVQVHCTTSCTCTFMVNENNRLNAMTHCSFSTHRDHTQEQNQTNILHYIYHPHVVWIYLHLHIHNFHTTIGEGGEKKQLDSLNIFLCSKVLKQLVGN